MAYVYTPPGGTAYTFENVRDLAGLSVPPIRSVEYPRAGVHGSIMGDQLLAARPFSINGYINGTSESDLTTKLDSLKLAMAPTNADGTLTIDSRILFCRPAGLDYIRSAQTRFLQDYQAQFKAQDPRFYSSTQYTQDIALPTATGGFSFPLAFPLAFGTISVGGILLATNAGNFESPPTIKIYGPVDNPRIKNITSGLSLEFNLTVAAGDYLEIDFLNHNVMLNGTASRFSYLTLAEWWTLDPGVNELRYEASTYSAGSYARVIWRDAWI